MEMDNESMERGREERRRQEEDDDEVSSSAKRRKRTATPVDIDLEALDCTICYSPLKPPVFQCAVGHVVCASCRARLAGATRCHMCSAPAPTAGACYNRCYAVEHILDSVRVPCTHAARGCEATTAYHERDAHERACPHAPCFCPDPGCGFATAAPPLLLAHLTSPAASPHAWPCSALALGEDLEVPAQRGVRVLRAEDGGPDGDRSMLLFLLVIDPVAAAGAGPEDDAGLAVSVLHVQPLDAARSGFLCHLRYTCRTMDGGFHCSLRWVRSANLAAGVPEERCPFVLPRASDRRGSRGSLIKVTIYKKITG